MQSEKLYIECTCHSPEHIIRFEIQEYKDDPPELFLNVQLNQYRFWWQRLILGIRYIFNKANSPYGYWDSTHLNKDSARQLGILCHQYYAAMEKYDREYKSRQKTKE